MKRKKMNVRLLRRVQRAIVKHPDQFQMSWLFSRYLDTGDPPGGCGTAACIAGWAHHLGGKRKTPWDSRQGCVTWDRARKLLGLSATQANAIFHTDGWPDTFRRKYQKARTPETMARFAADRIEHFIRTKGEE